MWLSAFILHLDTGAEQAMMISSHGRSDMINEIVRTRETCNYDPLTCSAF